MSPYTIRALVTEKSKENAVDHIHLSGMLLLLARAYVPGPIPSIQVESSSTSTFEFAHVAMISWYHSTFDVSNNRSCSIFVHDKVYSSLLVYLRGRSRVVDGLYSTESVLQQSPQKVV